MENDTLAGYFLSHRHIDFFNNSVTNSTLFKTGISYKARTNFIAIKVTYNRATS